MVETFHVSSAASEAISKIAGRQMPGILDSQSEPYAKDPHMHVTKSYIAKRNLPVLVRGAIVLDWAVIGNVVFAMSLK
jgi:hypothetical protein